MEGDERVLQFIRPESAHEVRGDENQLIAEANLATPDFRLQIRRGKAALPVRVRKGAEARAAAQIGLCGAHSGNVQFVVANDGDCHANRRRHSRSRGSAAHQGAALPGVHESFVGRHDRLDQADANARRFVVVILVPDHVGHETRGLASLRSGHHRGDQQVELTLRSSS